MNNCSAFDDALFSVLKECKTLPVFLDAVFGFLRRRTDFYVVTTDPKAPVGLPPRWAENFVKQAFLKWKPQNKSQSEMLPEDSIPEAIIETEVSTCENICNSEFSITNEASKSKREVIQSPRLTGTANSEFLSSESYNGAAYHNYSWSQTIVDLDITVKLPENITSKQLVVDITTQKIHITFKDTGQILLSGDLCQKVKYSDVLWAVENRKLQIHLDKVQEMWWDCLIQAEPKLDLSKIDCSRPFEELPEDAQIKIEELAWNQERKLQGLPTSDEIAIHETLKKAWNAEGSPFSGPFDPSKVAIN